MTAIARMEFNSNAQLMTALDRKHRYVINFGGKGSGKTYTHRHWAIDRGTFDTAQLHGIFTNTEKQLKQGVLVELAEGLPAMGVEMEYGHKPPRQMFQHWARNNIPIPAITDYRGIMWTSQGLHALCGTLLKSNYKQYETLQFGSLRLEEVPALEEIALTTILTRLRCGAGESCELSPALGGRGHRHQAHIYGNPPVGVHRWLFQWLDKWEEGAKQNYHAIESGETCECAKQHGPPLQHRQWPLLRQGMGNAILIQSRTSDNVKNLGSVYGQSLAQNFDKKTAAAWLEGELIREVTAGCYETFTDANVRRVQYDPTRVLYVCIDINIEPRVAVLTQPLMPGEYPSDWETPGVEQLGIFGEFFNVGPMADQSFAEALMNGGRGTGDAVPAYLDDLLRGLTANWAGLSEHKGKVIFYGDPTGHTKSVHDAELGASWDIMRRVFSRLGERFGFDVPKERSPARLRIHAVNGKLMNALGRPSVSIDPRARQVLADCETVVWDTNGLAEREWRFGAEMLRTHCMAGFGYMVLRRSPLGQEAMGEASTYVPKVHGKPLQIPRLR